MHRPGQQQKFTHDGYQVVCEDRDAGYHRVGELLHRLKPAG
jgi:hypothetical protein